MKKLFKYEINESVAAKAAMNCVHKRLFKELYMGRPAPQEEVVYGDYDPYEWEDDAYGNGTKRELIQQALVQAGLVQSEKDAWQFNNKIQQLLDKTNMPVSNAQEAMNFVKAYGQQIVGKPQEQEEMTGEDDRKMWQDIPQMEQRDIILAVAEYLSESWIDTGDDGDLDDIYYAVEYLLDSKPKSKECPQSPAWEDCKPWCSRHYKDVEEQISAQF